jgi:hypothetical protein
LIYASYSRQTKELSFFGTEGSADVSVKFIKKQNPLVKDSLVSQAIGGPVKTTLKSLEDARQICAFLERYGHASFAGSLDTPAPPESLEYYDIGWEAFWSSVFSNFEQPKDASADGSESQDANVSEEARTESISRLVTLTETALHEAVTELRGANNPEDLGLTDKEIEHLIKLLKLSISYLETMIPQETGLTGLLEDTAEKTIEASEKIEGAVKAGATFGRAVGFAAEKINELIHMLGGGL